MLEGSRMRATRARRARHDTHAHNPQTMSVWPFGMLYLRSVRKNWVHRPRAIYWLFSNMQNIAMLDRFGLQKYPFSYIHVRDEIWSEGEGPFFLSVLSRSYLENVTYQKCDQAHQPLFEQAMAEFERAAGHEPTSSPPPTWRRCLSHRSRARWPT